ncbi:MAG: serine--tRNA ligase [Chlamydiota bacterium]
MLDIAFLRKETKKATAALQGKIPNLSLEEVLSLDQKLKEAVTHLESLKARQNVASKLIGEKKRLQEDVSNVLADMKNLRAEIQEWQDKVQELRPEFQTALDKLPNIPKKEVPVSPDPIDNVCVKTVGEKPSFSFPIKNHLELGTALGLFDFKKSAKITGSNWPLYTGEGARLERALLSYMLDVHHKNGFTEIMPPLLVNGRTMHGAGQLPKFRDQLFSLGDEQFPFYLIPTAEVPLNGLHQEEILDTLPKLYTAYTPCFRREAGALGKQERGLIRMHQFNKVELFCVCSAENAEEMFEKMLLSAEEVLQGLGLHYRNMLLVTGDLSFASEKTIDIEAFLPAQNRYYEVSSVSSCGDFQARRAKIRVRTPSGVKYAHTLNGSGLATSRLLVALLETCQKEDGSVQVPEVLGPYLQGSSLILQKAATA